MKVILRPQQSLLMSPSTVFSSQNSTNGDQTIQLVNLSALNNFINNSSNDSSQSQGNEFDFKVLFKIFGGVVLASLVGVGLWKANKKPTENIGPTSASSPVTSSRNSPSNYSYTLEERIALAKQVCQDGNAGSHCQTMAPLNALRILQAWGDPKGVNLDLATIKNRIEATEKEAFSKSNWLDDGQMHTGSIIKNIVPQIIFDELGIPFGEYTVSSSKIFLDRPSQTQEHKIYHESLLQVLEELNRGKVGTFSYLYPYGRHVQVRNVTKHFGSHMITVYGFEGGSSYEEFKTLMARKDSLTESNFQAQFNGLLPNIGKLYCYEQDNRSILLKHHQINISDLLNPNGDYRIAEFTIMDGDSSKREITINTLSAAYSNGQFELMLRPQAKQKYSHLSPKDKFRYMLSRLHDLSPGCADGIEVDFNPTNENDYITAT